MKEKRRANIIKTIIITAMLSLFFAFYITSLNDANVRSQYLKNIDYNVTVNKDGSMNVVETWDINVNKTNTLFKTFDINKTKYSNIDNVKVCEIKNGRKTELTKINTPTYHVAKNHYYGLNTSSHKFEIAWGIGMDNKCGRRIYEVSYVVNDVVTDYRDCQELYWQFLAEGQNNIPARKVTGTITLPQDVSNLDKLRVWGHGQLNGDINKIDNHTVKFKMNNLEAGSKLEVRVITEEKMFNVATNKQRNYLNISRAIDEETKWSDTANQDSKKHKSFMNKVYLIYIIIIMIFIFKILKYIKINKKDGNNIQKKELTYYRNIPREDSTPTEALYLYKFNKKRLGTGSIQRNAVTATILDLCLKKKISLRLSEKEKVYIKIIDTAEGLNADEKEIYTLLKKVSKKNEFEINELTKYARKKYYEYSASINKSVNHARKSLYKLGLINKSEERIYASLEHIKGTSSFIRVMYIWSIVNHLVWMIPVFSLKLVSMFGIGFRDSVLKIILMAFPIVCEIIYMLNLKGNIKNKIAVLTQQGSDEKAEWNGLVNYMKDFSLLKEKTVPELALWEKYLVYSTAFGISHKVVEQMKATYPEVFIKERWEEDHISEKYPVLDFISSPIHDSSLINIIDTIDRNISHAYSTSQQEIRNHASSGSSSSGFGGGGGFSGGGGGRWWPVAGMGGR